MGKQYDYVKNAPRIGATFGVFSRGRTDDVAPGRRADGRTTSTESAGAWRLWVRGRRTDDGLRRRTAATTTIGLKSCKIPSVRLLERIGFLDFDDGARRGRG